MHTLRPSTLDLVRPITNVLLGVSRERDDVVAMLRDGPTHFMALTAGVELPYLISDVIKNIADSGKSAFSVSGDEICEVVGFFVMCTFGSKSTNRIGACYASNFQRLAYNVAACTVALYSDVSQRLDSDVLNAKSASLRRAACLVAHFTEGLKHWFPISGWLNGLTRWHALTYALEMTNETIVEVNNPHVRKLPFLLFCDEIFRHVLEERELENSVGGVADLKTSFGWCACSQHFEFVLKCCTEKSVKQLLPNAWLFAALVHHAFNAPLLVVDSCTRPASPGDDDHDDGGRAPKSKRSIEQNTEGGATAKRLCL